MSTFGIDVPEETVCIFGAGTSKHEALDRLAARVSDYGQLPDREVFRTAIHEREAIMSTGIGSGIAIPHVRMQGIPKAVLGVGVSEEGIDFDTLDNESVHVVVMFAMPEDSQKEYLSLLAEVMLALKTPGFRDKLVACKTPQEAAANLNNSKA